MNKLLGENYWDNFEGEILLVCKDLDIQYEIQPEYQHEAGFKSYAMQLCQIILYELGERKKGKSNKMVPCNANFDLMIPYIDLDQFKEAIVWAITTDKAERNKGHEFESNVKNLWQILLNRPFVYEN